MAPAKLKIVYINGVRFKDVTNETTSNSTYNYQEALALTKGKIIVTSN